MNPNKIKTQVLTENTAQGVLNHLKALQSNRARMQTRWIWELLQNARDTSPDNGKRLVASVKYRQGELIFQHNGAKFKIKEIAHPGQLHYKLNFTMGLCYFWLFYGS